MTQTLGMTSEVMYISKVTVSKVTRMPKVAHLVCIKVTHVQNSMSAWSDM